MGKSQNTGKVGRFEIDGVLGSGAQGMVFRAKDPRLGRFVAIKTLKISGRTQADRASQIRALLDESRIVSQLSHPNIVTLFDAGEDGDVPYMVFECVEGQVLTDKIRASRKLGVTESVNIAIQVLKAVGYAHKKGILHRDIKPGNVILTHEGNARVMDFGIAQLISSDVSDEESFCGTPCYMAPEHANGQPFSERADLFSVGMLLYESLTGSTAVANGNVFQVLHKMANQPFAAPSTRNSAVDERLDSLVMKALSKKPEQRYENAEAMEVALAAYLNPEPVAPQADSVIASSTLDFLMRRMRNKSDFPALSSTIGAINQATHDERKGVSNLAETILRDFALTNKILKLVNTASYGHYGGRISTISRAIVLLGFDRVRSVAATLMLFEHLQNQTQTVRLKEDLIAAYFCGLLARQITVTAGWASPEEAFVCAMFHDLGRMLVRFYLSDESDEIDTMSAQRDIDEDSAALHVLGISLEDLAIGVATSWQFPDAIIKSMQRVDVKKLRAPSDGADKLRITASLSARICASLRKHDEETWKRELRRLVSQFSPAMKLNEERLLTSIRAALGDMNEDSGFAELSGSDSEFLTRARILCADDISDEDQSKKSGNSDQIGNDAQTVIDIVQGPDRHAILAAGTKEVTDAMVAGTGLSDILRLIVDIMHRGAGFTRTLLCMRNQQSSALSARFGFGPGIDNILRKGFSVPLSAGNNILQTAVTGGIDTYIKDIEHAETRDLLPDWYRALFPARAFAIFPIADGNNTMGMLYGDYDDPAHPALQENELALLKILRNQAVLAIKQNAR